MPAPTTLTPVESRGGRLFKREDLHTAGGVVNGSKLRACQHLIGCAAAAGATEVISAASVHSPQSAMAAVVAAAHGLPATVILGATTDHAAMRHPSIRIAVEYGARLHHVPVGYNPYLQQRASRLADERPGAYWLRYGITPPPNASRDEVSDFHATTAKQVANLPPSVRTLIVPFGSGNTAAGVLLGISVRAPADLERIVLMGIGPDRRPWLTDRLAWLHARVPVPVEHIDLHGTGFAAYADKMPETLDGIDAHPTYEGKVIRYLNQHRPAWWERRDDTTCLWIVGGPLAGQTARAGRRRSGNAAGTGGRA